MGEKLNQVLFREKTLPAAVFFRFQYRDLQRGAILGFSGVQRSVSVVHTAFLFPLLLRGDLSHFHLSPISIVIWKLNSGVDLLFASLTFTITVEKMMRKHDRRFPRQPPYPAGHFNFGTTSESEI